jgi:hypothetical protein
LTNKEIYARVKNPTIIETIEFQKKGIKYEFGNNKIER